MTVISEVTNVNGAHLKAYADDYTSDFDTVYATPSSVVLYEIDLDDERQPLRRSNELLARDPAWTRWLDSIRANSAATAACEQE